MSKHWKNTDGIKPESDQANIQTEDTADFQYIRNHSMDKTCFVLCFSLTQFGAKIGREKAGNSLVWYLPPFSEVWYISVFFTFSFYRFKMILTV